MTHVHGRPDNQTENLEDILGRGKGDGDLYGYPGQKRYIGVDKPKVEYAQFNYEDFPEWWTWRHEPRDFGDNDAADPEQNLEEKEE